MTTSYTSLLGFALPQTGDLSGTWGDTVNASITQLAEDAIAGVTTKVITADWTLTTTGSGADNEARKAIIIPTGVGTTARNINAPKSSKAYIVVNNYGGSITFRGGPTAPTTGVVIATGEKVLVAWDGTDFVKIVPSAAGAGTVTSVGLSAPSFLSVSGSPVTGAGTLAISYSGTALPVANGGTGVTTPGTSGNVLTSNGSAWVSSAPSGGGTVTSVSGTGSVNGITLSGTVTSTGSLTLSGTLSNVSLSSQVTGTLPVANGGTGVTTPGTSGNVLTSNGSAWVSSAPSGGSLTGSTTSVKTVLGSGATSGSGDNNVMLGIDVGSSSSTGTFNVAIGKSTALGFTSGVANVAVGAFAMSTTGCSGSYNTAIGAYSLPSLTSGSGNIGIGGMTNSGGTFPVFNLTTENNRVVIGSTSVTNAYIQVAWTVVSDARDKTNFSPVPHGLNFVEQLNPIAYQFKTSRQDDTPTGIIRYGFKAQDILALEGENSVVIDAEDSEKLRINSDSLVPILVNAIKELSARVSALEASNG